MSNKPFSRIIIWLIAVLIIIGCAIPSVSTPAPVQVPDSQSSQILGTSVVQTAAVAQTKTAVALPSATLTPTITFTPTITHTPTPTYIFSLLFTPTPIPSSTALGLISAGGGNGSNDEEKSVFTGREWTCIVKSKYPGKGAVIKQEQTIIASWTIMNTGTKTWTNNGVDFVYLAGFRMDGRRIQDLPLNVAPGNQITLKIQLTTPKRSDTYSTTWGLKVGRRSFCGMKITFDVVE